MQVRKVPVAVAPVSRDDMELLAESYLNRFYPDNLLVPTSLDVLSLMDRLEDPPIRVVFGVEELAPGEEGLTNPITRQIIVDADVYAAAVAGDGRARMTLCHEIGHIQHIHQIKRVIGEGRLQLQRSFNRNVPIYRDPEWQANTVASALLMPRATASQVYRDSGVFGMVTKFQVSVAAAHVRIEVLRKMGRL